MYDRQQDWEDSSPVNMSDRQLCQCIGELLDRQKESRAYQRQMRALVGLIPRLPGISQCRDRRVDRGDREEVFNRACESVADSLGKFPILFELDLNQDDPTFIRQCFVKWFNKILKRRLFDFYRKRKIQWLSLDAIVSAEDGKTTYLELLCTEKLNEVDDLIAREQQQNYQRIGFKLQQYIETDPERKLRKLHPRNHPECNCQELGKRLLLKTPPDKLAEVAREFNVNYQTLNSYWKRHLVVFQELAKIFGYKQEDV